MLPTRCIQSPWTNADSQLGEPRAARRDVRPAILRPLLEDGGEPLRPLLELGLLPAPAHPVGPRLRRVRSRPAAGQLTPDGARELRRDPQVGVLDGVGHHLLPRAVTLATPLAARLHDQLELEHRDAQPDDREGDPGLPPHDAVLRPERQREAGEHERETAREGPQYPLERGPGPRPAAEPRQQGQRQRRERPHCGTPTPQLQDRHAESSHQPVDASTAVVLTEVRGGSWHVAPSRGSRFERVRGRSARGSDDRGPGRSSRSRVSRGSVPQCSRMALTPDMRTRPARRSAK